MVEKILNTRILLKYDTLANWNATTTYLRKGEVAIATVASGTGEEAGSVATPQVLVKVGDGKTLFKDLPFITAKAGDVYSWAKEPTLLYKDLPETLRDEIDALQAAVGTNGSVAQQIADAIKKAVEGLDVTDAEVANEVVVAVPQADGKVAPVRRKLVAADIPELAQEKITGLTGALSDLNTAITNETSARETAVQEAKGYADQKVTALANGAVATNTAAIAAEKARAEAAEAQALTDAKAYTDTLKNGQVKTNTDAISAINNDTTIVKSVKGDDVIKASIADNKLTIDFDDTLTFILKAGDSTNLDGTAQG